MGRKGGAFSQSRGRSPMQDHDRPLFSRVVIPFHPQRQSSPQTAVSNSDQTREPCCTDTQINPSYKCSRQGRSGRCRIIHSSITGS